jgi:hypothetical protein
VGGEVVAVEVDRFGRPVPVPREYEQPATFSFGVRKIPTPRLCVLGGVALTPRF